MPEKQFSRNDTRQSRFDCVIDLSSSSNSSNPLCHGTSGNFSLLTVLDVNVRGRDRDPVAITRSTTSACKLVSGYQYAYFPEHAG